MRILLTADWHIRGDRPRCRAEQDWLSVQAKDIQKVRDVYVATDCDEMWILGDLFHRAVCSTEAVNMLLHELQQWEPKEIKILPGNHDLPYHAYENLNSSSLGVVLKFYNELISGCYSGTCHLYTKPFGMDDPVADAETIREYECNVWATHRLTFPNKESRPVEDCGYLAQELLDIAPSIPLVLTGDYHHGYIYTATDGRRVVTPGCLNIQVADMEGYRPAVYVLNTYTGEIGKHELPGTTEIVSDYLVNEKERNERLEQCVATIGNTDGVSLDFEENLEKALQARQWPQVLVISHEIKKILQG